ncbi:coiled-coil and C2 domain-containing protein 1A [Bombina bombina]|uniref:coiled-coil and C2 domain-containing protein 1A n=1 Tax=Bombina bombina TaxID=8345 RepID=UPI00235A6E07|nr:coiled-coil and C2 domain-containing protein 1A [Bombina bombina]
MNNRKEARGRGGAKGAPFLLPGLDADNESEDEGSLEAELLALTGGKSSANKGKPKGKEPLPMEHIERMAALCMQDIEDDDEDLEEDEDEDLLAELEEVLGKESEAPKISVPIPQTAPQVGGIENTLSERLAMYKEALTNAKHAGDGTKARRYERGIKTLEDLLRSAKKGGSVNTDDIPPPVAVGKSCDAPGPVQIAPAPVLVVPLTPDPATQPKPVLPVNGESSRVPFALKVPPPVPTKPQSLPQLTEALKSTAPVVPSVPSTPSPESDGDRRRVLERQREYKLAALQSKQQGDSEMASKYYRVAKALDPVLAALDSGQPLNADSLPPSPDQLSQKASTQQQPPLKAPSVHQQPPVKAVSSPTVEPPSPPKDLLDALQQRMERYRTAAEQAKTKGEDRKARMHERIVKQYQDAIRSHKAGRPVNLAELPVPPGFPPIQGTDPSSQEQSIVGVLETAMKLANQQEGDSEGDEEDEKPASTLKVPPGSRPASQPQPAAPQKISPSKSPQISGKAQQQLQFLEGRRKQLMAAALRAKQHRDMEGAKMFLRQAKGLDPMIEASKGGMPVDITKVPQAPVNEDDFNLDQQRRAGGHAPSGEKYNNMMEILKQQHEMCVSYSQQFTHLGNITETTKYEKLAEECMKYINIVKQAHSRGLPVPRCHYEERTVSIVKMFPELSSTDLVLYVTRGVNFPAPTGTSPSDMDTYVRFEFAYPSLEEAQKDKTNVIKGTNSPVYKEKFTLQINRNHRGLKRAIQAKGVKFEVIMKGRLFKGDRVLGTAHLKLESLETNCEVREIVEVMDGRRPSGGKLEVCVRIREPLTSQQLSSSTEKWLVIDPIAFPPVSSSKPKPPTPVNSGSRSPQTLHSLSVLAYEKEKLEKKIFMYKQQRRPVPDDLISLVNDVTQRSQQLIQQLRQGGSSFRAEYVHQLERYLQFYGESARRLGQDGNRDAAKEALYKRNLVSNELQKLTR